ncbi:MAG: sporulation initiation factor Spo0A C-terminal domain-containing protein [Clostridia bacterium]|nr:sporulation initiation factor Spo0A C-terminal domain-containing protein [Clostridia bacterium]
MNKKEQICSQFVTSNYYLQKKMTTLGISSKYIAYYYLVDIMDLLINEDKKVHSFSREVFPFLAGKYQKNGCTVERNIRVIIGTFWDKTLKKKLQNFWQREDKPSCCEFIYLIKNYICKELA